MKNISKCTFRLVGPNISKHFTVRIRSETEVQKIVLNYPNVLKAVVPGQDSGRRLSTEVV
jgi:hypothetical protein